MRHNRLLASLDTAQMDTLLPHLESVSLKLGEVLYEPGLSYRYLYFPTSAIVSLHYVLESGMSAETSGVGNEGIVGISLLLGGNTCSGSAMVHTSGHAYRIDRRMLPTLFANGSPLQSLFLKYLQTLITQTAQTAVCNRHHSLHQQLCRWLLQTLDRIPSGELVMTQELIASMLGVRREGVTEAAGKLQQAGYIRYRRGHITVLDRSGLEAQSCECYAVVKKEAARLLPVRDVCTA